MRYQIYRNRALAAYNNCCAWCGSQYDLCLDHVQTQATGGADTFDNLQVLCRRSYRLAIRKLTMGKFGKNSKF